MRNRIVALETMQGRVVLSPQLLALVWVIALAVMGAAASSAVSAYQVNTMVETVEKLALRMERHIRTPYHEGARYETNDLLRRMSRVDKEPLRQVPPPADP